MDQRTRNLQKAKELPFSPGVYLMNDGAGEVIYVGKAKQLKNRVTSYFQPAVHESPRTEMMVTRVFKFEVIITGTEDEALILENSLIKRYKPKFNVRLKDDKTYPYLKIRTDIPYPRIEWTRKVRKDAARYFGPFPSAWSARVTMKLLTETFLLRDCSDNVFAHRSRPCILYQMGKCSAPCVDFTDQSLYADQLQRVIDTLDGKSDAVVKSLKSGMDNAAEEMDFEKAAELRDQWMSLQVVTKPQVVDANDSQVNRDVLGIAREGTQCQAVILQVRNGKLLSLKPYSIQNSDPDLPLKELLSQILEQHYVELNALKSNEDIPRVASHTWPEAVLVAETPLEYEWLERTLSIRVLTPETDAERSLLQVAETNAAHGLKTSQTTQGSHGMSALEDVQAKLGLAKAPRRIECYDISNTQGTDSVASRVVFVDGAPDKSLYRRYKIKTVQGANDFASMREVLGRRFMRTDEDLPDLVVVDGGKGQLQQAILILEELNLFGKVPVCGLAKARTEGSFQDREVESSQERIFLPNRLNPIPLPNHSKAFKILTHLRDEAHRFAITYHRSVRSKRVLG